MGTINEKLTYLNETKEAIKTAITNKGVTVEDADTFRSYAEKIDSIVGGASIDTYIETSFESSEKYIGTKAIKELPDFTYTGTSANTKLNTERFFNGLRGLKIMPKIDFGTNRPSSFNYFFYDCQSLEDISNLLELDTTDVATCNYMFYNCFALTNIPEFDTGKSTTFNYFLYADNASSRYNLQSIAKLNFESVINVANMFYTSTTDAYANLTDLGGFENLGKAFTSTRSNYSNYTLNIKQLTKLTYDSLMNIINNLYDLNLTYDVANGGTLYTQKIVLHADCLGLLSDDEIAIATAKGWTVSTS